MDKALYKDDKGEKIINAYDITPLEYQEKYKGKLFCTGDGCTAELVHMELPKRGNIRCFRTLQNRNTLMDVPMKLLEVASLEG